MPFEYLEHTADVGIHAWGPTPGEAFADAGRALTSLMLDLERIEEQVERPIEIEGSDREDLLVAWLNELIYRFDAEKLAFRRFEIEQFEEKRLRAVGYGERIDPARHEIRTLVKAATYHGLAIEQRADGWHLRVILDV